MRRRKSFTGDNEPPGKRHKHRRAPTLRGGRGGSGTKAPADWMGALTANRDENVAKMAPRLMNNNNPMDYHGALGVLRTIVKERPDPTLANEGATALDL